MTFTVVDKRLREPCSPDWDPDVVYSSGMTCYSWRCACGAGPPMGGVFIGAENARGNFLCHKYGLEYSYVATPQPPNLVLEQMWRKDIERMLAENPLHIAAAIVGLIGVLMVSLLALGVI